MVIDSHGLRRGLHSCAAMRRVLWLSIPTAYAVGFSLVPLRGGCSLLDRSLRDRSLPDRSLRD